MKTFIKALGLALLAVALASADANAQTTRFKALYLYNFAKNIGWTDGNIDDEIVITIIGDEVLAAELLKVTSTKRVGKRTIEVRQAPSATAVPKSHIIYLGESKCSQITDLVASQKGKRVLIVSGKDGLCQMGAGIAFVPNKGKVSYEISNENIRKSGLTFSQKILQLGTSVD